MNAPAKKKSPAKNVTVKADTFEPKKAFPFAIHPDDRDKTARNSARLAAVSTVAASRVIVAAEGKTVIGEILDVPGLIGFLREQATCVQAGNLSEAEAMLMNQATALQSLFARLTERGMSCEHVAGFEVNMRMALKAQAQCRSTLEALAEIKNPRPVAFVKQANIAHGPQQINNGTQATGAIPAHGEKTIQSNELSGAGHELLEDTRASQAQSRVNQTVETVGAIDRAKD